jgi:YD repeat-containing protein
MMLKRAFLILIAAGVAAAAAAQQSPNIERGLLPDKAYEVSDVDTVGLFGGVVNLAIPLGIRYHVNGNLSYQFTLSYATNSWETGENTVDEQIEEPPWILTHHYTWAFPARRMNAGAGWMLSFGELLAPEAQNSQWVYRSQDGGDHAFYDTLHLNDPNEHLYTGSGSGTDPLWVRYTRDGTYLRLRKLTNSFELDFPNGDVHTFNTAGKLVSIRDRYANQVSIVYSTYAGTYGTSSMWTITDTTGRTHYVYFRPGASYEEFSKSGLVAHEIVDSIDLAAFGGQRAVYHLEYANNTSNPPSSIIFRRYPDSAEPEPSIATTTAASLLTAVALPMDSLRYEFTYASVDAPSGNIVNLKLPSGANVQYGYLTPYEFPTSTWSSSAGVTSRIVTDSDNTLLSWTEYQPDRYAPGYTESAERRIVRQRDASGGVLTETRNYFTTCSLNQCGHANEYGLPLTRVGMPANGPFLSSEVLKPATSGEPVVERSTSVRYEADTNLSGTWLHTSDLNRRLVYSKTTYEDGTFSDHTLSNFDGLGNYRETVSGGDNPNGGTSVSTLTRFNPTRGRMDVASNGTFSGDFTMPPVASPWILGTFDLQQTTENGQISTVSACFDTNGFLAGRRTYAAFGASAGVAPTKSGTDLLALFTADANGNVSREQYLGGDSGTAAYLSSTCLDSSATESFRLEHRYAFGTRRKSYFVDENGLSLSQFALDADVDSNTGFINAQRDTSRADSSGATDGGGLKREFSYDLLGRLSREGPPTAQSERGAARRLVFSQSSRNVDIFDETPNGGTVLRKRMLELDGLGRVKKETRTIPGGATATASRIWDYDTLGRVVDASAWGNQTPLVLTHFHYDHLGRLLDQTAPDGSVTSYTYLGIRRSSATAKVHTAAGQETDVTSTADFDGQGRMRRLTDGAGVMTRYSYDVAGRLTQVCADEANGCVQNRSFTYDNRGFLGSEQTPELGVSGNGTASYQYDARGNVTRRTTGAALGLFDVKTQYDRAGRAKRIYEAKLTDGVNRDLKLFEYGTANSGTDYRNGRLTRATRYNWIESVAYNVQIIEEYSYAGRDGRISNRRTYDSLCVGLASSCNVLFAGQHKEDFTQTFSYDALGAVVSQDQPSCTTGFCYDAHVPALTVDNAYEDGALTSVTWTSAPRAATITYHDNGMVKRVMHPNLVVDDILLDAARNPRPYEITTTNVVNGGTCVAPTFTLQPQSTIISSGSSANFSARADGETGQTVSYQWFRGIYPDRSASQGTGTISGGVAHYTTPALTATTSYWVEATNSCPNSARNSETATVSICTSPSATVQPAAVSITRSQSVDLLATASGTGTLTYQWYTAGSTDTAIVGATTSKLTVAPTAQTSYKVKVSNACATVSSNTVTITVFNPPGKPSSITATSDGTANTVTWSAASSNVGIGSYEVQRRDGVSFVVQMPATRILVNGPSGVVAGTAYLYRVRGVDLNGVAGTWSNYDLTTTVAFGNDTQSGVSVIMGSHIGQLRQAIDAVRAQAGMVSAWSSYAAATGAIYAGQIIEMRNRLNEARAALGLAPVAYGAPTLTPGPTVITGAQIEELRGGVK